MHSGFIDELKIICEYAKTKNIKICLDVSKNVFMNANLPKVDRYRLDYGFTLDEIVMLSKKIKIELNASTIKYDDLLYLKKNYVNLADLRISYNFFPKKYSGISYEEVQKKNKEFHKLGMNVLIYIPSHNQKRPPMYEGLPSIEAHRTLDLYSILSTIRPLECDGIFFGDSYASKEELLLASNFDYDEAVIPIVVSQDISVYELELLKRNHHNRIDFSEVFVRSSVRSKEDILPHLIKERNILDITVDNAKFLRYQGEVCIQKQKVEKDERVNVVARAVTTIDVIKMIGPGRKFRFVILGEYAEN